MACCHDQRFGARLAAAATTPLFYATMADQLHFRIVTPQQEVLETETAWVTLPGSEGELGILPEHVPLVTALDSGLLTYQTPGGPKRMAVHYGYAQVVGNTVNVLSQMAERAEDIDLSRAQNAEQHAREELSRLIAPQEAEEDRMQKYESKLKRAMVRQHLGD